MQRSRKIWKALSVLLVIVLFGCTATPSAAPSVPTSPKGEPVENTPGQPTAVPQKPAAVDEPVALISNKPRILQPQASVGDLKAFADANTAFAFDLYQKLRGEKGNLFFSPYSISLALAMTEAGARGKTLSEMDQALHFSLPQDQLHPAFNALDQAIDQAAKADASGTEATPFKLSIANSTWGQKDYPFRSDYLDLLAQNYGAGLRLADFESNPDAARKAINDWVSQQTEHKIQDLIPQGAITPLSRMVLANAIYFKAAWQLPFTESETKVGDFHTKDEATVSVPLMHNSGQMPYAAGEGWQAVELPYSSPNFGMVVLLPESGQFDAFEQSLDGKKVAEILNSLDSTQVNVTLPKFKYDSSFSLKDTLSALGMNSAFDPNTADFSGMSDKRELYISSVVHKAFVSVDEHGTEAAAATGVVMGLLSAPAEPILFNADRPFLFLIRERSTGTILFAGRVLQP